MTLEGIKKNLLVHITSAHTTEHHEVYPTECYPIVTKTLSNNPFNTVSRNRQSSFLLRNNQT